MRVKSKQELCKEINMKDLGSLVCMEIRRGKKVGKVMAITRYILFAKCLSFNMYYAKPMFTSLALYLKLNAGIVLLVTRRRKS